MKDESSFVPALDVERIVAGGKPVEQLMLELIPRAKTFAIPPISNFYVGAVARGLSGALYFGANYEFRGEALSFCVHAEQAATVNAMAHGETGLERIAVSAAPCGYCRQFLNELTTAASLQVVVVGRPEAPLASLLPAAFGPADLGVEAALMSPQSHGLSIDGDDPLAAAALAAANASYAPYSHSYAGVALQTHDGAIFTGSVAENAAYNPSMSPLEAALVTLTMGGRKPYGEIAGAVLVELAGAAAGQADATRAVLSAIIDVPLRVVHAR